LLISHQPKKNSWVFYLTVKLEIYSHEIAMIFQSSAEMIMTSWLFLAAIKKQNIIARNRHDFSIPNRNDNNPHGYSI
jgi:hypothetical protein